MFNWIELIVNGLLTIVFGIIGISQWRKEMVGNFGFKINPVFDWKKCSENKKEEYRVGYELEIFNNSNIDIYDFNITIKNKEIWCKFDGNDLSEHLQFINVGEYTDLPMGQSVKWFMMGANSIECKDLDFIEFNIKYKYGLRLFFHKKTIKINRKCLDILELRKKDFF